MKYKVVVGYLLWYFWLLFENLSLVKFLKEGGGVFLKININY